MELLVISNDPESQCWLTSRLQERGFRTQAAQSADQALREAIGLSAHAVLIDQNVAQGNAAQAVRTLRRGDRDQPILVIRDQKDWREAIDCLDAGADDYLTKPVRSEEIAARLRAIIRRGSGNSSNKLTCGPLELDLKAGCAWLDEKCLNLTRNEFRLLRLFFLAGDRLLSHHEIHDRLYSSDTEFSPNVVEVQIARLRRKVGSDRIKTIRGAGYRLITEQVNHSSHSAPKETCKAGTCLPLNRDDEPFATIPDISDKRQRVN